MGGGVAEMHVIAAPRSIRFLGAPVVHSTHREGREGGLSPPAGFWSTSVPPELMNMAGDGIPHGKLDCLSQDLTTVSKGGLSHKAGGQALVGGIIASCVSLQMTSRSQQRLCPEICLIYCRFR